MDSTHEAATFRLAIPDMNCGHCKASVEKAIASVDAGAFVTIDLAQRTAEIETSASSETIRNALQAKGYPATVIG